jgi:hypothetical protein
MVKKFTLVTASLIILVISTVYLSVFPNASVYGWDTHMKFVNNTPFPLKFQVEAASSCTAQPNQTCNAGADYVWYNTYICPGVYPFDDNGTLTESKCSLAAYEFFKYAEPELVKALEEIAQALEDAEEDGDEEDMDMLTQLNSTVGGINADFAKGYYVLAWTSGIYGDKTVTATLDPTTGKFSLKG